MGTTTQDPKREANDEWFVPTVPDAPADTVARSRARGRSLVRLDLIVIRCAIRRAARAAARRLVFGAEGAAL